MKGSFLLDVTWRTRVFNSGKSAIIGSIQGEGAWKPGVPEIRDNVSDARENPLTAVILKRADRDRFPAGCLLFHPEDAWGPVYLKSPNAPPL
jgi:hypothetical protein